MNPESWRTNNQEKKCFADFRWILRDRVEDGRGGGEEEFGCLTIKFT